MDGSTVMCEPYGSGHINNTYRVETDKGREYILQRINKNVFKDPVSLMGNIIAVTKHLGKFTKSGESLTLVPTTYNTFWDVDSDGEYWRMYDFITNSLCLQQAETPDDFMESGWAFGMFQQYLESFPAAELVETIPRFHDTPNRYKDFKEAVKKDAADRVREVGPEIEFALQREGYSHTLMDLQKKGDLPLRVTHNDTKLNNVLFDINTRKAICVVDFDTIMPGLSVNDFGDSIRFGASTATEDEKDLDKVTLSLPLLEAYTKGFTSACGKSLTKVEMEHLRDGAKMMTLEVGLRMLTDYIAGDIYFKIHHPTHNLDRCRTQFKLVSEMEKNWDKMQKIILM